MKTIKQVLSKAKFGDVLTNGKLYWKIDYHYDRIASPITKAGKPSRSGFELWTSGIEAVAVIPGLRIMKGSN